MNRGLNDANFRDLPPNIRWIAPCRVRDDNSGAELEGCDTRDAVRQAWLLMAQREEQRETKLSDTIMEESVNALNNEKG